MIPLTNPVKSTLKHTFNLVITYYGRTRTVPLSAPDMATLQRIGVAHVRAFAAKIGVSPFAVDFRAVPVT